MELMRTSVDLRIDALVLYGLAPGDRDRLGRAVEHELARLFAERGVPAPLLRGGETAQRDGGTLDLTPAASPEALGARVAQAIYRGLSA
jgi:hypothetical protein